MKNYGKRKVPRDIGEFEDLIKPYYDKGDYQYAYNSLISFWKRKGKSVRSSSMMWEALFASAFNGNINIDIFHLANNYGVGFDEYAYDFKEYLLPRIEKEFANRYGNTIDYLKQFYKVVRWVNTTENELIFFDTDYYIEKAPKEVTFSSEWISNVNDNKYLAYLIIQYQLQKIFNAVERDFRVENGLSANSYKWKGEGLLLDKLKSHFSEDVIIGQGSPPWLELQRFDVWIPEHKIAVEFNGLQHYEPIDFFGGEEGFKNTQKLDNQKKQKCIDNNVTLIEIREGYSFIELTNEIRTLMLNS